MRYNNQFPSFFQWLQFRFGYNNVKSLKLWEKYNRNIIKTKLQILFFKNCIGSGIFPQHCNFASNVKLCHYKSKASWAKIRNAFIIKLLRLEINDAHRHLQSLQHGLFNLTSDIFRIFPPTVWNFYLRGKSFSLHYFYLRESRRLDKKFQWLLKKQKPLSNITPINYFYSVEQKITNKDTGGRTLRSNKNFPPSVKACTTFSSKKILNIPHNNSIQTGEVFVSPMIFNEHTRPPLSIRDKWFINLSSKNIPDEIQGLLQLGDGFCVPTCSPKDKVITEFIKHIEDNVSKIAKKDPNLARNTRNHALLIIQNMIHYNYPRNNIDIDILHALTSTKNFINNNRDVIFTRADKGNITVALDKTTYYEKMTEMLNDKNTYMTVTRNPINTIVTELHSLLKKWRDRGFVSPSVYKRLNSFISALPRAYGLPKIHKEGNPLRIIVSSVNSPLYMVSSFLHEIIHKSIPSPPSQVHNSFHLIEKLSNVHLEEHYELVSLDVTSLFTNVPIELAIESISKRWALISKNTTIPIDEFIFAMRMIFNSTYFIFNDIIYKQTFGMPMGSPLSPIISDIVLQDLEAKAIARLPVTIPFYVRYVDDIAMAVPSSFFSNLLEIFNSFHPRLKFTMEIGQKKTLNFLDIKIININGGLIFDWFHKPTFSGRYLNFHSQHPLCQKRGTIIGLIDRAFFLSHPSFHQKNIDLIINILLENGYPIKFIFDTINSRLKHLLHRNNNSMKCQNPDPKSFFVLPYISSISEKFVSILRKTELRPAYTGLDNLKHFIRVHKDPLPRTELSNVVYRIDCGGCDASYVGQTKRFLKTRVMEHRNHIGRSSSQCSVITDHRNSNNHDFDWEGVRVLDREPCYQKRLISEMLYIKRQKQGINLQSDTDSLHSSYLPIIESLKKF